MSEREILFRGQIRKKGEKVNVAGEPIPGRWVYGGIWHLKENDERAIIYQREPKIDKFVVYADTIGRYTGLTDRNGTKIFEGDIIEYEDSYGISRYSVFWNSGSACFCVSGYNGMKIGDFTFFASERCDVIGNIHDNPELMKGE